MIVKSSSSRLFTWPRAFRGRTLKTAAAVICGLTGSMTPAPGQTEPLDIPLLLNTGRAAVSHTGIDIGPIHNIFDGDSATIARTPAVNPMVVTLSFTTPRTLLRSGVWFQAGDNRWRVETADTLADLDAGSGSFRVALDWRTDSDGGWRERDFAAPVTAGCARLKLRRLTGDDHVHLADWRLFPRDQPFVITGFQPAAPAPSLTWNSALHQCMRSRPRPIW